MMTEWAWADGKLTLAESSIDSFAKSVSATLQSSFPKKFGNHTASFEAIREDVSITLKRLCYGGRKPSVLHPKRVNFLKEKFDPISVFDKNCHGPVTKLTA